MRGAPLPARAILSMGGLSHGVIRVNTEDKNSALTVQDVGHIMPGGEPLQYASIDKAELPHLLFILKLILFLSEGKDVVVTCVCVFQL